jgi:D-alanine-D-alanine ligase-like ATP-grasp enzyme
MWTFDHLWHFLETHYKGSDEKQPAQFYKKKIVDKIKEIILITFSSVKRKLNQNDRKHCFEMFGFDFLIDADLNTWLIEVNTNPAIEECSAVT